jgi:hypothetical protein
MQQPETHYARSGDAWIAYQVTGDGPVDLMLITGVTIHSTHTSTSSPSVGSSTD